MFVEGRVGHTSVDCFELSDEPAVGDKVSRALFDGGDEEHRGEHEYHLLRRNSVSAGGGSDRLDLQHRAV